MFDDLDGFAQARKQEIEQRRIQQEEAQTRARAAEYERAIAEEAQRQAITHAELERKQQAERRQAARTKLEYLANDAYPFKGVLERYAHVVFSYTSVQPEIKAPEIIAKNLEKPEIRWKLYALIDKGHIYRFHEVSIILLCDSNTEPIEILLSGVHLRGSNLDHEVIDRSHIDTRPLWKRVFWRTQNSSDYTLDKVVCSHNLAPSVKAVINILRTHDPCIQYRQSTSTSYSSYSGEVDMG